MQTPFPWFFDISPEQSDYATAKSALFGIPYGGPGFEDCAQAPAAVFEASPQVESFDDELGWYSGESGIATVGREELSRPLTSLDEAAQLIDRFLPQLLSDGKFPLMVGGSGAVVAPALAHHLERCPDLGVVRFDAMASVVSQLPASPVAAVGLRRVSEAEWGALQGREALTTVWGGGWTPGDWLGEFRKAIAPLPRQVYVSVDVSALDPALMPATPVAEPGGLSWQQLCRGLSELFAAHEVVGLDVTGLTPIAGLHSADFLVAKLLYRAIGLKYGASRKVLVD
ncbi:MAG TPA: arginase family protein [Stenomitos sp.]